MSKINERQLRFLGHIIRKEGIECTALQGRVDGKRGRGRSREKFMDRIKKITGLGTTTEVFRLTSDRDGWKNMITQACNMHGTYRRRTAAELKSRNFC